MTATAEDFTVYQVPETPTPGPWEYVPSNENHGPYVVGPFGGDICDCYTMSNPSAPAFCNGGDSKPIPFQHGRADANARLIAAAPELAAVARNLHRLSLVITAAVGRDDPRNLAQVIDLIKDNQAVLKKAEFGIGSQAQP